MEQPERTTIARQTEQIQQATARDARRRALVAGCFGNLVEWYDFALYGAFATVLAAAFFPKPTRSAGCWPTGAAATAAGSGRPLRWAWPPGSPRPRG